MNTKASYTQPAGITLHQLDIIRRSAARDVARGKALAQQYLAAETVVAMCEEIAAARGTPFKERAAPVAAGLSEDVKQ